MNKLLRYLPDKLFGKDVSVLLVWALPGGLIPVLIMVFFAVVMPRVEETQNYLTQKNKITKEIVSINAKRTYLLSLDQAELKANSDIVENGVLSEKNTYLLVKVIGRVVADYGYSVGDFSINLGDVKEVDKTTLKFDYQRVPVDVVISGPKQNFLAMVGGIEKSLPILSIDSFNMTGTGDVANIKISVFAYYSPEWTPEKLENLSVTDLTPSKDETAVLSQISGFKFYGTSQGEINSSKQVFVPSERVDPFY